MRIAYQLAPLLALVLAVSAAPAQEPRPGAVFAGEWKNVEQDSASTTRLEITKAGDKWLIQGWGSCRPQDCDWGKVVLEQVANSAPGEPAEYAFAKWPVGFKDHYVLLHLEKELLVVESYHLYKDDRTHRRIVERFRKAK